MSKTSFTLASIAEHIGAQLVGDDNYKISGIATLQAATASQVAFLANPLYRKHLADTQAGAVILRSADAEGFTGNALLLDNPYAGYARLTALFAHRRVVSSQVHPTAVIDPTAQLAADVQLGPHAVVEAGAVLETGVIVGAGTVIGANSRVGAGSLLHANVSIYHDCVIGPRAVIHSGVVIGGDGFGFAPDQGEWIKIHHLAGVVIGADVEMGANTCVDRGALSDTLIGDGVKLDNMVQVAHGVSIGDYTVIAGCSAIAGSASIGRHCMIGGAAGIVGHLTIADGVTVTAMSLVTKSITEPGSYSSGTPLMPSKEWRKRAVRFGQLESMHQRLQWLEARSPGASED